MPFMLTHHTAVRWYRSAEPEQLDSRLRCFVSEANLEASRTRLSGLDHSYLRNLPRPLHLLVGLEHNRRRSAEVVNHRYFGPDINVPAYRVAQGLFVSSPELTYLVEARTMDYCELLFLGYELCSQYGIQQLGDGSRALFHRPSICTVESLRAFVSEHRHVRGRRIALAALESVAGGARSPMESSLGAVFSAAVEYGGFGLPVPGLNVSLSVPSELRVLGDAGYYVPDLLYASGNLIVEYDSDQFHTASDQIAANSIRRNALESMGYRVVAVTRQQMSSFAEIARVARIIAAHLGLAAPEVGESQQVLHQRLLRLAVDENALFRETSAEAANLRHERSWHSHRHENNPTLY